MYLRSLVDVFSFSSLNGFSQSINLPSLLHLYTIGLRHIALLPTATQGITHCQLLFEDGFEDIPLWIDCRLHI